jgi:hypothetical protein
LSIASRFNWLFDLSSLMRRIAAEPAPWAETNS